MFRTRVVATRHAFFDGAGRFSQATGHGLQWPPRGEHRSRFRVIIILKVFDSFVAGLTAMLPLLAPTTRLLSGQTTVRLVFFLLPSLRVKFCATVLLVAANQDYDGNVSPALPR
jgi:hypothetical protein